MRILILGTGAMAKRFGAQLARPEAAASRAGRTSVSLAGSWPAALDAIAARGIVVEDPQAKETWSVPVQVFSREQVPRAAFDLVLVLVKSYQTAEVAAAAASALAPGGLILTLQNGIGNREILVAAAAGARVTAGVTSTGATGLGPARVRFGGPGQTTLGEILATTGAQTDQAPGLAASSSPSPLPGITVQALARRFNQAGLATDTTRQIDRLLWRKLAVNCAINPLTALEGLPNGALLEASELQTRMRAAAREVERVAAAAGIELGLDAAALAEDVARKTAGNRSSMLQDLDRGARTEIDAICGAVVREGRRLDVPTPVNRALWSAVTARTKARAHDTRDVA